MMEKSSEPILFVDDEQMLLDGVKRQFFNQFNILTACGGQAGLEILRREKVALIVSDMIMPEMNGSQFLQKAKEICPDSVRVILSGQSEIFDVIASINDGNIFRFLVKPCPRDVLEKVLLDCLRQYRLVTAEKTLLQETLQGSIRLIIDLFSSINPDSFHRGKAVQALAKAFLRKHPAEDAWAIELAATFFQIGYALLPADLNMKLAIGQKLSTEEQKLLSHHVEMGRQLIGNIPRLEKVGLIIGYQNKNFDGTGVPPDPLRGEKIPLGARLLRIAIDYDSLTSGGALPKEALAAMKHRPGTYDPKILETFSAVFSGAAQKPALTISIHGLMPGMILARDLKTLEGMVFLHRETEITPAVLARVKSYSDKIETTVQICSN